MKLRVYLDTSVFSAYYDDRAADRQAATRECWARFGEFDVSTSELASEELARTAEERKRESCQGLLVGMTVLPVTDETRELADRYVASGVFAPAMYNDALHVAAAVTARQDILLSWNFKHLVNRRRRAMINQMNVLLGLPMIDILAPPEL